MTETMGTCPACGAAALRASVEDIAVPFRGGSVVVPAVSVDVCGSCGEKPMLAAAAQELQDRAVAIARTERGLLTPDEIRTIRKKRGLTQRQLEIALGVGEKTVVRWEKGSVFQSAATNTLMELVRDMDGLAEALLLTRSDIAPSQVMRVEVAAPVAASASEPVATGDDEWVNGFDFLVTLPADACGPTLLGMTVKSPRALEGLVSWEFSCAPLKTGREVHLELPAAA